MSYADHVRAYEKSVVLGGARRLFPIHPNDTELFAQVIRDTVIEAENAAYKRGVDDARRAMRQALGMPK